MHVVFFDLETTGLINRNEPMPAVVEAAAMHINQSLTFETLVDPQIAIPPAATAIHCITDEMVNTAPPIAVVCQQLIEWVKSFCAENDVCFLVSHNSHSFDMPILTYWMIQSELTIPTNWRFADTMPLIPKLVPKFHSCKLVSLKNICIEVLKAEPQQLHRSMADVKSLNDVILKLFENENDMVSAFVTNIIETNKYSVRSK